MKTRSRFLIVLLLSVLVLILIKPSVYMDAVLQGGELFLFKVFPALFPFFIITKLLTLLGVGNLISRILDKPLKYMYNTSPIGGYIFVLSIISGYPIGAKLISEFRECGRLSDCEAKNIMSFTSTSGPLFIIGTVGLKMLRNYRAGALILISHMLSAIINGFVFRGGGEPENSFQDIDDGLINNFYNDAIVSSITSIMQVAASMIILNILIVAFDQAGVISVIGRVFEFIGLDENISIGVVYGLIEITQGISLISSQTQTIKDIIVPISVIISFGGLSVLIQSMTFLAPIGIKIRYYLVTKLSQAVFAYVISTLLVMVFY